MILVGLAYRNVGQPRFFLFPGNTEAVVSGSTRGASPACPCSAGTTAFGNRTRSQPRLRGCSRGLGCYPNKQRNRHPAASRMSVSCICGNKCPACQVAQKTFSPAFFNLCSSGNCRFRASVLQKFIACICYSKNLPFCIYLGNKSRLEQIIQSSYPFGTLLLTDFSIHHGRTSLN